MQSSPQRIPSTSVRPTPPALTATTVAAPAPIGVITQTSVATLRLRQGVRTSVAGLLTVTGPGRMDRLWKVGIVGLLAAIFAAAFHFGAPAVLDAVFDRRLTFDDASAAIWLLGLLFYGLQVFHAVRYRAVAPVSDGELPTCTVIVPAYNESARVRIALVSALENRYPRERLHVIAVDDGSRDDTWEHIRAIAEAYPGRVTPVRMARNGGKREALREGFARARGEVVVTVDSDSLLSPDALRHLVAPLSRDARVGAVAGKVLVLNRHANLLTRLIAARFLATFDLARAAQSRFNAVLCTPGALAGYRRAAVMDVLGAWSTQTFLGKPCTIGEDRALTTWLLRAGWRSVYQSSATVQTLMPTTYGGLSRMYLRWERGSIREDLVLLPVLASRWRERDRWWPSLEVVFGLVQYPVAYAALALAIRRVAIEPTFLVWVFALLGGAALLQSLYCLRSERGSDFLYGVGYVFLAFFGLQWIYPYSWLTLRNGAWLTR